MNAYRTFVARHVNIGFGPITNSMNFGGMQFSREGLGAQQLSRCCAFR